MARAELDSWRDATRPRGPGGRLRTPRGRPPGSGDRVARIPVPARVAGRGTRRTGPGARSEASKRAPKPTRNDRNHSQARSLRRGRFGRVLTPAKCVDKAPAEAG